MIDDADLAALSESTAVPRSHQVFRRATLRAPVDVREIEAQGRAGRVIGRLLNISANGAFIATKALLEKGEAISLKCVLPPPGPELRCQAEVVWVRLPDPYEPYEAGVGVKFVGLAPQAETELDDFVRAVNTTRHKP